MSVGTEISVGKKSAGIFNVFSKTSRISFKADRPLTVLGEAREVGLSKIGETATVVNGGMVVRIEITGSRFSAIDADGKSFFRLFARDWRHKRSVHRLLGSGKGSAGFVRVSQRELEHELFNNSGERLAIVRGGVCVTAGRGGV